MKTIPFLIPLFGIFLAASGEVKSPYSIPLPEGNYRVTVTLGSDQNESITTIKAESRRLMLLNIHVPAGQSVTKTFAVNVRTPKIADGKNVKLKDREFDSLNWDDKLSLEFCGPSAAVRSVDVKPIEQATTVYIAGDSTVTDGGGEPWAGWGQMLPAFFNDTVAVANHAESGRALYSFRGELRLEKILSVIKPGDYLFIQFGHNDQKDKTPGSGAMTSYKQNLEQYISVVRQKGATPVLVTPMYRRRFTDGQLQNSLGEFPDAVRLVAKEQNVPLIDLHASSGQFFQALGTDESKKAFVHYPANSFPGQDKELKDDTHFNNYGAYELARCVVEGIRKSEIPLAKQLREDVKPFDPAHPDSVDAVSIPASAPRAVVKPEGN